MVIDHEDGRLKWEGLLDTSGNVDEFFFHASKPQNVGIVAADEKIAQKTVDQLHLAGIREERMKLEHRRRR